MCRENQLNCVQLKPFAKSGASIGPAGNLFITPPTLLRIQYSTHAGPRIHTLLLALVLASTLILIVSHRGRTRMFHRI